MVGGDCAEIVRAGGVNRDSPDCAGVLYEEHCGYRSVGNMPWNSRNSW